DVKLPNFIGLNYNELKKNSDYQFKWEVEEVFDSDFGSGVIVDQTPSENMIIKSTGAVKLKVSKGIESVTVPQIKGLPWREAFQLLQERKLVVSLVLQANDSVSEGQAYMTSPESGTKLDAGSVVTLYINPTAGGSGVATYMVDVVGMTLNDAKQVLLYNRIHIKEVIYENNEMEKGRIFEQDIQPRALVPFSDGVTLKVSDGSPDKPFEWSAKLPFSVDGNTSYSCTAVLNGEQFFSKTIKDGPKSQKFELVGSGEGTLIVYVNGQVLYELRFLFDDGSKHLVVDNSGSFQMSKPSGVDKSELNIAITSAQNLLARIGGDITVTDSPTVTGYYITNGDKSNIDSALAAAISARDDSSASQSAINSATNALKNAINGLPRSYTAPPEEEDDGG
ncbi:MAG: PASTA domain-containing protein, partial [Oscillospiraceae bacterium]|nr:PASTA domain-containing protein [Oscillospiraceae bacterium]